MKYFISFLTMTAWTRSGFHLGAAGSLLLGLQVTKFRLKCEFMGSSPVHLLYLYRGVYTAVMEDEQNKQFFNRRSYRRPHGCWRLQLLPLSCSALESRCTWTLPRMHSGWTECRGDCLRKLSHSVVLCLATLVCVQSLLELCWASYLSRESHVV